MKTEGILIQSKVFGLCLPVFVCGIDWFFARLASLCEQRGSSKHSFEVCPPRDWYLADEYSKESCINHFM